MCIAVWVNSRKEWVDVFIKIMNACMHVCMYVRMHAYTYVCSVCKYLFTESLFFIAFNINDPVGPLK